MSELVFEAAQETRWRLLRLAVGESVYTQGDSWQELRAMVLDPVRCHFEPAGIPLRLTRDEVLAVA